MKIGWVGGLGRARAHLESAAEAEGHELEVHSGETGGRGSLELEGLVERCDLVVIVVEVNSHNGALQAKSLARRHGRPSVIVRKSSVSTLKRVVAGLRHRPAPFE
ncbi:MAG: DUF2325 domain-containing protein [Polyangiaceae bacterium]